MSTKLNNWWVAWIYTIFFRSWLSENKLYTHELAIAFQPTVYRFRRLCCCFIGALCRFCVLIFLNTFYWICCFFFGLTSRVSGKYFFMILFSSFFWLDRFLCLVHSCGIDYSFYLFGVDDHVWTFYLVNLTRLFRFNKNQGRKMFLTPWY